MTLRNPAARPLGRTIPPNRDRSRGLPGRLAVSFGASFSALPDTRFQ